MLRRQDVGHRMVVRRIVGIRDGRPVFSDALGELVELTETHLTMATAKGELRVPLTEVHRAKRVPPARRPTATTVVALELAANEAWPALVQERLGDWRLRAADGWTGRANSALPVGDPDRPLEAAIDAVADWYAARRQPATINVPLPLAAPIGSALDRRGWTARPPVLVQTVPLTALLAAVPARADLPPVELATEPSAAWIALAAARKAGPAAELPAAAWHVLTAVDQVRFAHLYADSGDADPQLLGVARGTVTGDGRWLGLTLIEVVPAARRQGLAQQLVRGLAEWAVELGASHAFLQVEEHNSGAVALYRRLGFTTHHTYVSRLAPSSDG
ncbi:GNAT family N-acetyltransferase [Micromonospora sp. NPDC003197]